MKLAVIVIAFIVLAFCAAAQIDKHNRPTLIQQSQRDIVRCHDIGGKAALRPNAYGDWIFRECIQ